MGVGELKNGKAAGKDEIMGEISLGVQEKGKDMETKKKKIEEKVVGFSSASPFLIKKWEAVTKVETWNQGDRSLDVEENPGNQYIQMLGRQARLRVHSRYTTHVKQE